MTALGLKEANFEVVDGLGLWEYMQKQTDIEQHLAAQTIFC